MVISIIQHHYTPYYFPILLFHPNVQATDNADDEGGDEDELQPMDEEEEAEEEEVEEEEDKVKSFVFTICMHGTHGVNGLTTSLGG